MSNSLKEALQREPLAASVRDPWRRRFELISREPLATGSLSLTARPLLRTTVKRGGVVSRQTTEPLPPAGSAAATASPASGAGPVAPPPPAGVSAVGERAGSATPQEEVIRRPVTDVEFVFRYGPGTSDTVRLTVAAKAN
jgi:hypothetical protein